ncbi:MAG: diguanylate cyclase [Campylobacterales bacterium]|jgi:diguanylate cyclase (GGDEF)-like protein
MQQQVNFDKLKYLYNSVPIILVIHFFSVLLFSMIMLHYVDNLALIVWIAVTMVVLLFRLYHYLLYTNSSDEELLANSTLWLHRYYTYVLIGGGLWGSTALLLFPQHEILYQMVVVLFTLGITATALGIISASWELVVAYALLSFAPLIIRLAWMEEPLYQTIAYIVTALGILMIFTAKHFGTVIDKALYSNFALSQARSDLASTKGELFTLLENAPIGIFYYDRGLRITDLNGRLLQILRRDERKALLGYDLNTLADERIKPALESALKNKEGHYEGMFYSSLAERTLYVELLTVPITDNHKEVKGAICFLKDLTAEMEARESHRQNAFYDPMTKLPNRVLFSDRLHLSLKQRVRHHFCCAVLFLDLDRFKHINDQFGRQTGDRLLYEVGQRLLKHVRSEDTVARVEGDQFLILLNALTYDEDDARHLALEIADSLLDAVKGDYEIDEHRVSVTASIGAFVCAGTADDDPDSIIKRADAAMHEAKHSGKNQAILFQSDFIKP